MSKMVSELGFGPFRSVFIQPSLGDLRDGTPPGPVKRLWVPILIFTNNFMHRKY